MVEQSTYGQFQHEKNALDAMIMEQIQINVSNKITISKISEEIQNLKMQLEKLSSASPA